MHHNIYIEEQGLRDGLQTVSHIFSTEQKLIWTRDLIEAGVKRIQIGSFVHKGKIPAMADTDDLFLRSTHEQQQVLISGLALNKKGLERAIHCGAKYLSISLSASETHSLKNTGKTIEQAKEEIKEMIVLAKEKNIKVRSGIQCAFGCRFEGKISENVVLDLAEYLISCGADELFLADSTGMAHPVQVDRMIKQVISIAGNNPIGLHLHNTENKGYANLYAGLNAGVTIIDTAFGGLGGCPFIKGATGNIATEDVVHMLDQMGVDTGIDMYKLAKISLEIEKVLGYPLPGLMYKMIQNKTIALI
ncbi:MAG: hydroxymethylglutaryl-CoA lyase [Saprospiraceae bacterium]|nr:hydroxymethylglutaryl-CoA lyase [Saprospiraceae bacterium]